MGRQAMSRLSVQCLEARDVPASFVVTSLADSGAGSLRRAVTSANALPGLDTITFTVTGTITLTSGQVNIDDALTVNGPGAGSLSISGNSTSRVFEIGQATTISGVTLTKGLASNANGGAILSHSDLTLANCTLTNNTAGVEGGAVCSDSSLTLNINNCQLLSNKAGVTGGAVSSAAIPTALRDSYVSNNTSAAATVWATSELDLESCTVAKNSSSGNQPAVQVGNSASLHPLTIVNSTISGNGYGVSAHNYQIGATASVISSTIAFNANIGLDITCPTEIKSSVVAKNGINLVAAPFAVTATNSLVESGPALNAQSMNNLPPGTDPLLAPLDNYGDATVPTHALLPGSPLVDAGSNPLNLTTDVRGSGFSRVSGPMLKADIGAYEAQPLAVVIKVNGGGVQRSVVTSLVVAFNQPIDTTLTAASFSLQRTGPSGPTGFVVLDVSKNNVNYTLTFAHDSMLTSIGYQRMLIDGRYNATVLTTGIAGAGGTLSSDAALSFHRLFGDADGDGDVDAMDYGQFMAAAGGGAGSVAYNATFDSDGDFDVDAADFGAFRKRYGSSIP
jgi:predicted outer membrane repeat protein